MSFDILRVIRAAKLARKRPRVFGPSLVAIPLVVAPLLAGFVAGRRGFYTAAIVGLILVVAYAQVALQPLVRFIEPIPAEIPIGQRLRRVLVRHPLGMMLGVGIGVTLWLAFWGLIFREKAMIEHPWATAWIIGIFATLGGIAWWEIFYGKEARRRRDRVAKKAGRVSQSTV